MSTDLTPLVKEILEACRRHEKDTVRNGISNLTNQLTSPGSVISDTQGQQLLRCFIDHRWFEFAEALGQAFVNHGNSSLRVRRLHAQALIERGSLNHAQKELESILKVKGIPPSERDEVLGFIGRVQKQLFIQAITARGRVVDAQIKKAISAYLKGYDADPPANGWHGINAVALLKRAERDGLKSSSIRDADKLAEDILNNIKVKQPLNIWDYGTAAEACIALNRYDEARAFLIEYAWHPNITAFNLGSTLRQFEEIWQLETREPQLKELLTLLRARLLELESGQVTLSPANVRGMLEQKSSIRYEKVFGADHFVTFERYRQGLDRCSAVARIGRETSRGEGTGFVMRGKDLSAKLGEEVVLITNFHVISTDGTEGLHPKDAVISFHALDGVKTDETFLVKQLLWSSPKNNLDASVATLDRQVPIKGSYPIAPVLPNKGTGARVLVIGHPGGGALSFSLNDNELLDYEAQKIHYRAPTEGGSSGSPVFNQDWKLIGLHHAGNDSMPRLNGQAGTYQANEGIWIKSIIDAFNSEYSST